MKRGVIADGAVYHVYNRGADRRKIFVDEKDYLRFVHDMSEFNEEGNSIGVGYKFIQNPVKIAGLDDDEKKPKKKKPLVSILAFALMPNHFHLLLIQKENNGITLFMKKLGSGYALYFNQKYKRSGVLFQGRFKSVHIKKNSHLKHIPYYIHANPLDLNRRREDEIKFINSYRWSSHMDYCGWRNFPSVTERSFLLDFFDGEENYRKSIAEWVKDRSDNLEKVREVALEKFAVLFLFITLSLECLLQDL